MNEPAQDKIDRLLLEDAHRVLPDDGFCARVVAALPPTAAPRAWLRPALVLGSAALGSILAWGLAPAGTSLLQGFLDLARLHSSTPSAFAALGLTIGLAAVAAALLADES